MAKSKKAVVEPVVEEQEFIEVFGAREHNLKNIDIRIPKNKLVVFTGVSGSGKSSLAFDTIYNEGQRRYMESFSAYARQFIGDMERPDVDKITGLSPVISIEQKTTNKNPYPTEVFFARSDLIVRACRVLPRACQLQLRCHEFYTDRPASLQ